MNEQEKREYDRAYKASKQQGEPFYPNAIIKDVLVALFIFLLLVALSAFFRAELQAPADPTDSSYIPHPEWYFLFLYEMLKFFPGNLVIIGVIVLPGVVFTILFLLPWLDRRADRHPRKRPAIMALMTFAWTIIVGFTLLAFISAPPPTETAPAVVGLNRQQADPDKLRLWRPAPAVTVSLVKADQTRRSRAASSRRSAVRAFWPPSLTTPCSILLATGCQIAGWRRSARATAAHSTTPRSR